MCAPNGLRKVIKAKDFYDLCGFVILHGFLKKGKVAKCGEKMLVYATQSVIFSVVNFFVIVLSSVLSLWFMFIVCTRVETSIFCLLVCAA